MVLLSQYLVKQWCYAMMFLQAGFPYVNNYIGRLLKTKLQLHIFMPLPK